MSRTISKSMSKTVSTWFRYIELYISRDKRTFSASMRRGGTIVENLNKMDVSPSINLPQKGLSQRAE